MEINQINPDTLIRPVDLTTKYSDTVQELSKVVYQLAQEIQNIQVHINIMKKEIVKLERADT